MTETDTHSVNDESHEQLVAYLDGELDSESSRQVEERLARDERFRLELQASNKRGTSWMNCRRDVGTSFTQTTVEVVALSAEQELQLTRRSTRRRLSLFWTVTAASVLIVSVTSYVAFLRVLARPARQLVRDYPVIDNIELYSVADSVEFLHQLDDEGLFAQEEVENGL